MAVFDEPVRAWIGRLPITFPAWASRTFVVGKTWSAYVSSTIVLCSIQRRIGSLVSCHCNVVHGLRGLCSASFYSRDRLAFSLVDRQRHIKLWASWWYMKPVYPSISTPKKCLVMTLRRSFYFLSISSNRSTWFCFCKVTEGRKLRKMQNLLSGYTPPHGVQRLEDLFIRPVSPWVFLGQSKPVSKVHANLSSQ